MIEYGSYSIGYTKSLKALEYEGYLVLLLLLGPKPPKPLILPQCNEGLTWSFCEIWGHEKCLHFKVKCKLEHIESSK